MGKRVRDVTKFSDAAEAASQRIDIERQFGIPDLARLLRSAYYHGYRDALLEQSSETTKPPKSEA